MPSIPASFFLSVTPGVIQAAGASLGMNAIILSSSAQIPIGQLMGFADAAEVLDWFGPNAIETALAGIYFTPFNGAEKTPTALYFAQYNTAAVAGYLRSGFGLTLAEINAAGSGTLTIVIDGVSHVTSSIALGSVGSFSAAATAIQGGLSGATPTSAATCTYNAQIGAFEITSSTTGATSTVAFPTTNAFATALLLTAATGAIESPGAIAAVPAGLMTSLSQISQDWGTFMSAFDPDAGAAGGPIKQAFATWNAEQDDFYMYVAWDTDPTPSTELPDTACFAKQIASLSGTFPIWDSTATQAASVAAMVCGITASIAYDAPGGRTDFSFRSNPALVPDITSPTVFSNVTGTPENPGNGYNSYGNFATRTTEFQWLQQGTVTGPFEWADSYVNQIYWNAQFQNDFAAYQSTVKSTPYTQPGYNAVRQALMSDIIAMGAFGAWQAGVALSSEEAVAVNAAAGLNIAATLQNQGWYFQILDPGASVRQARGSPIIRFFYNDGGSIQQINMTSVDVE